MEFERAWELLEIETGDSLEIVKKKYRRIVARIHPDAVNPDVKNDKLQQTECSRTHEADIAEVNAAYEHMVKNGEYLKHRDHFLKKRRTTNGGWDAPVNPGAYIERDVYQYVEDHNCVRIGTFVAATGKYYWNHEAEDFSLFLKSIMEAAGTILEEKEAQSGPFAESEKFECRKELIYLLAGQFTDIESGIEAFSKKTVTDTEGRKTYYIPAMLELQRYDRRNPLSAGDSLSPLMMKDHRLFLGRKGEKPLGYLSFEDDRLYYVLIPMFENREVQVRIKVAEPMEHSRSGRDYLKLHLWIRQVEQKFGIQESTNRKIDDLLNKLV